MKSFTRAGPYVTFGYRTNCPEDELHLDDAKAMAVQLMGLHGLWGWTFRFDHARRRFGCCRYRAKAISLSRWLVLLNTPDQVRDTLLHEIAHALTPGDGHGAKWKRKCAEIGAKPVRCYSDKHVRSPVAAAPKYRLGCQACQWWVDRRRLTNSRYVCRRCLKPLIYQERVAVLD
ncbi:MAG TPA: SprT-like domain-containing protein [Tepidisphaeraceae bacterium]